jgi:hypothetical protein
MLLRRDIRPAILLGTQLGVPSSKRSSLGQFCALHLEPTPRLGVVGTKLT